MYTRTNGRLGAAVVLAVGLLAASAMPAAAVPATHVSIEPSSNIEIRSSTTTTPVAPPIHTTGHQTTSPCPPVNSQPTNTGHIPVIWNSDGTGTVGAVNTGWALFPVGTNNFKARWIVISGSIISNLATHETTFTVILRTEFRTCDSLTPLCVTNSITAVLTTPSSRPVANHPQASELSTVSGLSAHITAPITCNNVIRTFVNSRHAAVDLNLHFKDSSA